MTNGALLTDITDAQANLYAAVQALYAETGDLPFHGWHHVRFVHDKSLVFARDLGADPVITQIAALVHDLNYLVHKGVFTPPAAGKNLRHDILLQCGMPLAVIDQIEVIVMNAEIGKGRDDMSLEAKALSDADTLFKALPTTPILFASRYIAQTNGTIRTLAEFIMHAQKLAFEEERYFYSDLARVMYMRWATTNFQLWECVLQSLDDPDIISMLEHAGFACE